MEDRKNATPEILSAKDLQELREIERFFRSGWFGVLTKVDPDLLITDLRKEKKTYDY